jgi:hypothetical protein
VTSRSPGPMSVVEEQAKELGVYAAGGAKDGGQERDAMIVGVGMLILRCRLCIWACLFDCWWALFGDFLLGGFTQRLVYIVYWNSYAV